MKTSKIKGAAAPSAFIAPLDFVRDKASKEGSAAKWVPHPGFQEEVLVDPSHEILLAGEKGAGKSAVSRAFLLKGNPDKPLFDRNNRPIGVNASYVEHPKYVALILRKNMEDLKDFIEHTRELYEPMGAVYYKSPFRIVWPKGAIFYTGHLSDETSWMKYLGQELHRIVLEEVVTIPSLELYEALMSCNRSSIPGIRPQILATMNPRGPGLAWLNEYFRHEPRPDKIGDLRMQVWDEEARVWRAPAGKPVSERQQLRIRVWDEENHKWVERTRRWYHGKLSDNPVQNTAEYRAALRTISTPGMREAYAYGSWDSQVGTYFTNFRPKGPMEKEPAEARHVRPATSYDPLMPWEAVAIGADWGFGHDAAAVRLSKRETGRIVVENCHSEAAYSCENFGRTIGEMVRGDVARIDTPIDVWLSPDCWSRESEVETEAIRIQRGIASVIGPERVWREGEDSWERERLEQAGMVRVKKAYNSRVAGWTFIAECMMWNEAEQTEAQYKFTREEADRIRQSKGESEYVRYMEAWKRSIPKERPVLIIAEGAQNSKLIQAIGRATHSGKGDGDIDKKHFDGMDVLDAFRYGMMGIQHWQPGSNEMIEQRKRLRDMLQRAQMDPTHENKMAVFSMVQWMEAKKKKGEDPSVSKMLANLRQPPNRMRRFSK